MSDRLQTAADAMVAAAATVLGTLAGRTVAAAGATCTQSEASIRIDPGAVATVTRIPAAGLSFVARYEKRDLGRVVELMLGTAGDGGELDAMQLSIVSETVAQLSTAMGDALATCAGIANDGIESTVAADAAAFPVPPFATFTAPLDLGDGFTTQIALDFDVLAQHRLDGAGGGEPPARRAARVDEGRPVTFAPMQPTASRPAAPGHANLDLVHDVPLEIAAVLGQTELPLRDVVAMQTGSVFELDKLATDPIDLYVNNILIARGEVVVVDDKFAVKISELNPIVERV